MLALLSSLCVSVDREKYEQGKRVLMLKQEEFNRFVESYNADYLYLLTRASRGDYQCLISSFTVLKDLHDVIMKLHDSLELHFRVVPYPLTFRGSDDLLSGFGFDAE